MDDDFEYLINTLFSDLRLHDTTDIPTKSWAKCIDILANIRSDSDLFEIFQEYFIEQFRRFLDKTFENFWIEYEQLFEDNKNSTNSQHCCTFIIVNNLDSLVSNWFNPNVINTMFRSDDTNCDQSCEAAKDEFVKKLHDIFYTSFTADMPLIFTNFLLNTFAFCFKVFDSNQVNKFKIEEKVQIDTSKCIVCEYKKESVCYCDNLATSFETFLNILRRLGIFNSLCADIIRSVIYTSIEKHIYDLCKGKNFDVSCLDLTLNWFRQNVLGWVKFIYSFELKNLALERNEQIDVVLEQIDFLKTSNIRNFIINTYIYCRMNQLFEIIIDYPYSETVLLDLQECIKFDPFYRDKFIHTLKSSFKTRLLHPGVSTTDIIEAYITAIKALKLLDPQGVILQIVCDPIRNYLKARDDTVRCIITSLTNDNIADSRQQNENITAKENEDDEVLDNWKCWVPQPIGVSKINKEVLHSDIITNLVNIFDSKDLFVQQYQHLLAQRLLSNMEIDMELEHRNLELLSLRFGESELHNCEVMLKDIKDSERVNQRINCEEMTPSTSKPFETSGFILSEQFWPDNLSFSSSFNDLKNLKLPPEVKEAFESYTKAFETIKVNRTLNWFHQLGSVKIELDLENGQPPTEYTVKPVQAVIIHQFQTRKLWRVSELSDELEMVPSQLRRHLLFWKNLGLLSELSHDTFILDEEGQQKPSSQKNLNNSQDFDSFDIDDEKKVNQQQENRLQIFWNFIDNMLKNLHALTLDRIFNMLKMFNMQSPEIESLTMHELRQFLDAKVIEGKLVYSNGLYNINSDGAFQ